MGISDNINRFKKEAGDNVKIIAVSKYKSAAEIRAAYEAGQRRFGENRVQELVSKYNELPKDIEWHFLGHLQTNKVRDIAPFIHMIHSADSLKILSEINKEGKKSNRIISCLLQFHIASEETKFGMDIQEANEILASPTLLTMDNICFAGVMGMATLTDDQSLIQSEFRNLKSIYSFLRDNYFKNNKAFCEISMGMSGDYKLAIQEGSTMIRIGTALFGEKNIT